MRTRLFAVALAACIPALVSAQKKGSGDPAPTPSTAPSAPASVKSPSARDLSDLNPASLLVDKKKKASLADSTVAQLKALAKKLDERNKQFYATYDSVRKLTLPLASNASASSTRPGFQPGDNTLSASTSSPAEQAKMQSSMRDLRQMMGQFRELRRTDVNDALAVVPDAQKKAATDLLSQQDGDLDKLVGSRP
jgi:hypothetical protein